MLFLFLGLACVRPFLKVSPTLEKPTDAPTLVTNISIDGNASTRSSDEIGLGDLISQKDNLKLDEAGDILLSQSTGWFRTEGFALYENKEQAQQLDLLKGEGIQTAKNVAQIVAGNWISPASSMVVINNDMILLKSYRNHVVEKIDSEVEGEFFLFASARVYKATNWFFVRPRIVLDYVLLSETNAIVMRARGLGFGKSNFWIMDRSPSNLGLAIEEAIESIKQAERKPLK